MRLIFLGPPGVGKGTQAKLFQERHGVAHISTGDILREAIEQGTALGRQARSYMDRGDLVPDDVMVGIVAERLRQPDAQRGFILDGFPRTLPQAESLECVLQEMGRPVEAVIYFELDEETAVRRSAGRLICRRCGAIYNVDHRPPRVAGACDICGGEVFQREDDRPEVVRRRHQVYRDQTAPLEAFYRARGALHRVDGKQGLEALYRAILALAKPQVGAPKASSANPGAAG
ncbi:MAG: adenylate kinase [Armatimonadetes bacterium]|nr:adenylate kinase [Armatimonadota bacterium]